MSEIQRRALTGIRPTGDLSIANYLGAMRPMVELQETYDGSLNVFVADLHALTDQEPDLVNRTRLDTVRSYIAAGIDPERTNVYLQSQIEPETVMLASRLDRHMTVAELLRVPTLKEKMKPSQKRTEEVTVALARYPILMAADIFVQDAVDVPVGKDQHPHIEVARTLARRFNAEYGVGSEVIVVPDMPESEIATEGLRIVALDGEGKMSKSRPRGAIFLKDSADEVAEKVRRAQTAHAGETSDALESHLLVCNQLTTNDRDSEYLESLKARHMSGEPVMGEFKAYMTEVVNQFLVQFQNAYDAIDLEETSRVLEKGGAAAKEQATSVLKRVDEAMNSKSGNSEGMAG